jgi:hypothetical protein
MARRKGAAEDYEGVDIDLPRDFMDSRVVLGGVSITWLATVFRMDKNVVKKKIAECPVLRMERGDRPLFDLKLVLPYFVPPAVRDLTEFIKRMNKDDLPLYMRNEFWDAQLKQQKYEENAGDLWRTEDVSDTLTEIFKLINDTLRMWPDTIEITNGLTDEQRKTLEYATDSLKSEMHRKLTENKRLADFTNSRIKNRVAVEAPAAIRRSLEDVL